MKLSTKVTLAGGLFAMAVFMVKAPNVIFSWLPPVDDWWWTLMVLFGATVLAEGTWTLGKFAYASVNRMRRSL